MVVIISAENSGLRRSWSCQDYTVSSAPVGRHERRAPSVHDSVQIDEQRGDQRLPKTNHFQPVELPDENEVLKKDKKWSIGKLFRRKKRESDSDSQSSDENSRKGNVKKKKVSKKKRSSINKQPFDHVINPSHGKRSQSVTKIPSKEYIDDGVLSDPSAGFIGYVGRNLTKPPYDRFHQSDFSDKRSQGSSCGSQDGSLRKGRRGRIKARVEAMRNIKNDSSSDEESQKSTSSSILKFRSDDSLHNHSKDVLLNKRSRSARTDRYIKRLSKDEEIQLSKEADIIQNYYRSEAEHKASRQRVLSTPQMNGSKSLDEPDYSEPQLVQPVHNFVPQDYSSYANISKLSQKQPSYVASNSSIYNNQSNGVINFNARVNSENITYSVPYSNLPKNIVEKNSNKPVFRRSASVDSNHGAFTPSHDNENVMVVKFPIGNVSSQRRDYLSPPVPPPRDPHRKVPTPLSFSYDNNRPLSYAFENGNTPQYSQSNQQYSNVGYNSQHLNGNNLNRFKRPISTSEDHIAMQEKYANNELRYENRRDEMKRPASVSNEVKPEFHNGISRPLPILNSALINKGNVPRRHTQDISNTDFLYFADKAPRSRKPIHITEGHLNVDYNVDNNSQNLPKRPNDKSQTRNASEFWRRMDSEESQRRKQLGHNRTLSDQNINKGVANNKSLINGSEKSNKVSYSSNLEPKNSNVLLKLEDKNHHLKGTIQNNQVCYSNIDIIPMDDIRRKYRSQSCKPSDEDSLGYRRKSTNLDDALSELEAIYNSLGLGDEDLLDRAEKRERQVPKSTEHYPFSYDGRENYFPCPNYVSDIGELSHYRQAVKKNDFPDKKHDDMAYRRLNRQDRPKSKDANNLVSQVSYMLASPVLSDTQEFIKMPNERNNDEPDIILDDVVFRNIRQSNNYLKIEDPQPPFGIPLGPVSPAPNSDYLHVTPEVKPRSRFIPQKCPDLVMDDLAYRSLRKDSKYPCGNANVNNSFVNNTSENINLSQPSKIFDNHVIKKKRAVRSLSANIFTLVQKEIDDALNLYNNRGMEKAQSIPDLPESVVEFGKSGKLPPNFKLSSQHIDMSNEIPNKSHINKIEFPLVNNIDDCKERLKPPTGNPLKSNNESKSKSVSPNITTEECRALDKMAEEAKKTSAKLEIALEELQREKSPVAPRKNIDKINDDITISSKIDQIKNEDYTESFKNKSTADSLIAISNQLRIAENKLKLSAEPEALEKDGTSFKILESKCNTLLQNSQTDLNSNKKPDKSIENVFTTNTRSTESMENLKTFDDLQKGINKLLDGMTDVAQTYKDSDFPSLKPTSESNKASEDLSNEPIQAENSRRSSRESPEYNSSEELAMIFNLNKEDSPTLKDEVKQKIEKESHLDLSSPRLVKTANQNLRKLSCEDADAKIDNIIPGEGCSHSINSDNDDNDKSKLVPWRVNRQQPKAESANKDKAHCGVTSHQNFKEEQPIAPTRRASAFRPVKPPRRKRSPVTTQVTSSNPHLKNKILFRDIKSIAKSFGEIVEFSDRGKAKPRCDHSDNAKKTNNDLENLTKAEEGQVSNTVQVPQKPARRIYSNRTVDDNEKTAMAGTADEANRVERIKKYKEERRRQLAAQSVDTSPPISSRLRSSRNKTKLNSENVTSSKAEEGAIRKTTQSHGITPLANARVRTTRASRLRAAASTQENSTPSKTSPTSKTELFLSSLACDSSEKENSGGSVNGNVVSDNKAVITVCEDLNDKVNETSAVKHWSAKTKEQSTPNNGRSPRGKAPSAKTSIGRTTSSEQTDNGVGRRTSDKTSISVTSVTADNKTSSPSSNLTKPTVATLARQSSPRSLLSHRSSSQSPLQSPNTAKLKQKRRSVELAKPPTRISPQSKGKNDSLKDDLESSLDSPIKSCAKQTNFKLDNEKTVTEKCVGSQKEAEQESAKRRLNSSSVNDSAYHSRIQGKMVPGLETRPRHKISPSSEIVNMSTSDNCASNKLENRRPHSHRLTTRMDALAALTKETLARVDKLTKKSTEKNDLARESLVIATASHNQHNLESNEKNSSLIDRPSTSRDINHVLNDIDNVTQHLLDFERRNSIESNTVDSFLRSSEPLAHTPVSILKRKSSQEEHGSLNHSLISTPPVTFSPNVIDPRPSRRHGQGILKKRRSLDESQVRRRRSCSPELASNNESSEPRPILKPQRRSSLEEIVRGRSPDGQIQGILKRKSSRDGDIAHEDNTSGSPEPQGILKRKSNSVSSGSNEATITSMFPPLTPAVSDFLVKESRSNSDSSASIPKSILKKKSLDGDHDEHHLRAVSILKSTKKSSQDDGNISSEEDRSSRRSSMLRHRSSEGSESESNVKPILKQRGSHSREHSQSPRPNLSFCSDDEDHQPVHLPNEEFILSRPQVPASVLRIPDDSEPQRPSRFEAGRLRSPSKLKKFFDGEEATGECLESPHFPSAVLRRRGLRPRTANRSKSLVSNLSDELNKILNTRRSLVDENCAISSSISENNNKETDERQNEASPVPSFPSVAQRIRSMENFIGNDLLGKRSLGAIPKRQQRDKERFKTQPVTVEEMNSLGLGITQSNLCSSLQKISDQQAFNNNTNKENNSLEKPTKNTNNISSETDCILDQFTKQHQPRHRNFEDYIRSQEQKVLGECSTSSGINDIHTNEKVDKDINAIPEFESLNSPERVKSICASNGFTLSPEDSCYRKFDTVIKSPDYRTAAPAFENIHKSPYKYQNNQSSVSNNSSFSVNTAPSFLTNSSTDDVKDSPTSAEYKKLYREISNRPSTLFASDNFDKFSKSYSLDSQVSLSDALGPASADTSSKSDTLNTLKEISAKSDRLKKLSEKNSEYHKNNSEEAALSELDRLQAELENVRVALDAESSALLGPVDHDHWSLNISVDSGVFNRMSSGDSGPLSGEDHSLPHDSHKQPENLILQKLGKAQSNKSIPDMDSKNNPDKCDSNDKNEDDEPIDSPQALYGLMKSNSVSARASMWQQLQMQANKAAIKPTMKHSKSKAKDGSPSVLERFRTQSITSQEDSSFDKSPAPLNQSKSSFNLSLDHDEDAKLDENDPAKLTLAEKMKLFGATASPKPPSGTNKKPRSPRFQTMPVLASQVDDAKQLNSKLDSSIISPQRKIMKISQPNKNDGELEFKDMKKNSVENYRKPPINTTDFNKVSPPQEAKLRKDNIGTNFKLAQEKLAEQASKMLTSEVKNILKSKSGAVPLLPNIKSEPVNDQAIFGFKSKSEIGTSEEDLTTKKILKKGESSEGLKDEGIESSSDDESTPTSSHSSKDSCSSSSSDSEDEINSRCQPHFLRHNLLKSSKTESDIRKVATNQNDGRVKLPCMDEIKARKIMQMCMSKGKENISGPKKNLSSAAMKHEIAPNRGISNLLIQKPSDKIVPQNSGVVKNLKVKDENASVNLMRKYIPQSVSKSQSMDTFTPKIMKELKTHNENNRLLVPRRDPMIEESGSEGESSGGREVRQITSRRKVNRSGSGGIQVAPEPSRVPVVFPGVGIGGLKRSATQPMAAPTMTQRGGTIAERLAALQQSGNNEWRKRVSRLSPDDEVTNVIEATKNRINESLTQKLQEKNNQIDPNELPGDILISDRRNKLETSAQGWRKRVGNHDAIQFSVAGRMGKDGAPSSPVPPLAAIITATPEKKTPIANRFKSRRADGTNGGLMKSATTAIVSEPASPLKRGIEFKRSISVSGVDDYATDNNTTPMTKSGDGSDLITPNVEGPSVPVPRADDETFTSFFTSASVVTSSSSSFIPYNNNNNAPQVIEDIDLDAIDSGTRHLLGGTAVNRVRAARKAGGSRNPLKALAARTDLRQEYTQPAMTGVADKEAARLNKEKVAQNSSMAVEALAGLASKEDFTSINLKKTVSSTMLFSSEVVKSINSELPNSPPMLIHIKGRRHVQVRLVEPTFNSINSGDCYVLVTRNQVFLYMGLYANVIERSRGAEIALHIHTHKDLGCSNSTSVITLDEQHKNKFPRQWKQFWSLLGLEGDADEFQPIPAGNIDEDEIYESGIISTNMCYEVVDDELVPMQEYWGQIPKIAMLDPSKILVFDFGSELYVWNGKNTILERRRMAFQLAQELWDEGYNYKECIVCPLHAPEMIGGRTEFSEVPKKSEQRPDWALITKVTQHMETVLFKDKFLDWPDFSRVIKIKEDEDGMKSNSTVIKPCDVEEMWIRDYEDPSLVLEGSHVGRGTNHYDKETMRHFEIKTKSITKWMIHEYDYVKLEDDLNHFYSGDSYILRWEYQMTVSGRELNGNPSKHNVTGRDRCAYFCWQGKDASANEKGAAALLTVELDHEKGPQVRVVQGNEPPAFLNLFKGTLIIHQGKKGSDKNRYQFYTVRGNVENEAHLIQVPCSMRQLRSRASMILIDVEDGHIYVWHGVKSLKHTKYVATESAKLIAAKKYNDFFDKNVVDVKVTEIKEGDEPKSFIDSLGGSNRQLYHSLLDKDNKTVEATDITPRLFHFTDLSGQFVANEILSPLRHENLVTPYPFSQKELYSVSQPGLFLLDSGDCLWLWQGWWPQNEDSDSSSEGATGSGSVRWQHCRKAAMETILNYWKISRPNIQEPKALIVVAGLEPIEFINLFDVWQDRDDVAELNIAYGCGIAEGPLSVTEELSRLSCTNYPLAILRQRPLPDAVDPAHIEKYLSDQAFKETFKMTKDEFYDLPAWKQANMKKDLGLF